MNSKWKAIIHRMAKPINSARKYDICWSLNIIVRQMLIALEQDRELYLGNYSLLDSPPDIVVSCKKASGG